MSKSRGNVIEPDEQVARYGADTVRAYLMFGYRWSEGGPWNPDNIQGIVRWLNRVWNLAQPATGESPGEGDTDGVRALQRKMHQTIRQVSHDLENFEFNTVVSALMEFTNTIVDAENAGLGGSVEYQRALDSLLILMAPVTPHIAEELWALRGGEFSIHQQVWPEFDPVLAKEDVVTLVVQVNGKVRDRIEVPATIEEAQAKELALSSEQVLRFTEGNPPKQVVYVPGRLINIVI
jgi:leucyl-tRNA synthetase